MVSLRMMKTTFVPAVLVILFLSPSGTSGQLHKASIATTSGTSSHENGGIECSKVNPSLRLMCYRRDLRDLSTSNTTPGYQTRDVFEDFSRRFVHNDTSVTTNEVIDVLLDSIPNFATEYKIHQVSHSVLYPQKDQRQVMLILTQGIGRSLAQEEARDFYLQFHNYTNMHVLVYNTSRTPGEDKYKNKEFESPEWASTGNLSFRNDTLENVHLMIYSDPILGYNMSAIVSIVRQIPLKSMICISLEGQNVEFLRFPDFLHELKKESIETVLVDMRDDRKRAGNILATLNSEGNIETYPISSPSTKLPYEKRIIIQFERDTTLDRAAKGMHEKNQDSSSLFWYNKRNGRAYKYSPIYDKYERILGQTSLMISINDEIELLGYGSQKNINGEMETRFSNLTAGEVSNSLQNIPGLTFDVEIRQITFVVCKKNPKGAYDRLDMPFLVSFHEEFSEIVKTNVVTRVDNLNITPYGKQANAIYSTRKALKFVVDREGNIDFLAGRNGYEVSVSPGSGPLRQPSYAGSNGIVNMANEKRYYVHGLDLAYETADSLNQVNIGLDMQDALISDYKQISEKIIEEFLDIFPQEDINGFEIDEVTVSEDKLIVEISKKRDKGVIGTLEINYDHVSSQTSKIMERLEKEVSYSSKFEDIAGFYGMARALQEAFASFEQEDNTDVLIDLEKVSQKAVKVTSSYEKLSGKIFGTIGKMQKSRMKSLNEELAAAFTKFGVEEAHEGFGKISRFAENIPILNMGFDAYAIVEDIEDLLSAKSKGDRAHAVVDLVLDTAVAALIPIKQLIKLPTGLEFALNVAHILVDDIWNDITIELKKVECPDEGTCFWHRLRAVFVGFFKGFKSAFYHFASFFYSTSHKAIKATEEFEGMITNYHEYYQELHKDGEPSTISFASGEMSMFGGDIHFVMHDDHSATFCYNLEGSNNCHNIPTYSDNIVLGIGESQYIKYKTVAKKKILLIPIGHVEVMDGLEEISSSLSGYYEGNHYDNEFFAVQELPPDVDLSYSLSSYFYELHGKDGDDVFHLGPQRSKVYGDDGSDTYILPATGGHTVISNYAEDGKQDMLYIGVPFRNLYAEFGETGDLVMTYLDTHSVVVEKWLDGQRYQHLNFMAQPGVIFDVSTVHWNPQLIPGAIDLRHQDHSFTMDISVPLYSTIVSMEGTDFDDSFVGNEKDNILNGGPGEDYLSGGNGQDVYIVKEGEGCDSIDNGATDLVNDILFMDVPVDRIETQVDRSDLYIYDAINRDTCAIIRSWFLDKEHQHLVLTVADFILLNISTNQKCFQKDTKDCVPLTAYEINEKTAESGKVIDASSPHLSHVRVIQGTPYEDRITGNSISNIINGGTGKDFLEGLNGADYYIIESDEGDKDINNEADDLVVDMLLFRVPFDEIWVQRRGYSLQICTTGVTVTVLRWFEGPLFQHMWVRTADGFIFNVTGDNEAVEKTPIVLDKTNSPVSVYIDAAKCDGNDVLLKAQDFLGSVGEFKSTRNCKESNVDLSSLTVISGSHHPDVLIGNDIHNIIQPGLGFGYLSGGNGIDTYDIKANGMSMIAINNFAKDNMRDVIKIQSNYSQLSILNSSDNNLIIAGVGDDTNVTIIVEDFKTSPLNRHLVFRTEQGNLFTAKSRKDSAACMENQDCLETWYMNPLMIDVSDSITDQRATLVDFPTDHAFLGVQGSKHASNHITGNRLDNNLLGGPFLDVIVGGDGQDVLKGFDGENFLFGEDGDDTLYGGSDDDWLLGDYDNDVIVPGFGVDMIDGGPGYDTVMYKGDPLEESGVMVNLAVASGWFGDADADVIENTENVYTSRYNDIVIGNSENNLIKSGDGDDILVSLEGTDLLQGGNGSDYYVFDLAIGYKEVDNCANDNKTDVIRMQKANTVCYYNIVKGDVHIFISESSSDSYVWDFRQMWQSLFHAENYYLLPEEEFPLIIVLRHFTSDETCQHAQFQQTNNTLMTFDEFKLANNSLPYVPFKVTLAIITIAIAVMLLVFLSFMVKKYRKRQKKPIVYVKLDNSNEDAEQDAMKMMKTSDTLSL